ncbi:MAG TPA: hypothetical protein VFQ51_08115, partial [Vicinamibacteria bacterium]|nr:hypothetical protein [Vicinamibacteria bacterium]
MRHTSRVCRVLVWAVSLAGPGGLAAAEADAPIANAPARQHVDLSGDWRTIVDPYANGHVDYRAQPRGDGG